MLFCFAVAPSSPPLNVTAVYTSSTSVKVLFADIPTDESNGIVRGFRIKICKLHDCEATTQIITVRLDSSRKRRATELSYDLHNKEIVGLEKFTEYKIQVLGYTVKEGNFSAPFIVRTAEDGKKTKKQTPTIIIIIIIIIKSQLQSQSQS